MTRLTIGLPVYNGASTLARSLDRLLAQTFTDFILIINDNASTDATAEICADYCRRDRRVRYYRNAENVSWYDNFRTVLLRAETPYFMWVTHDDLWEPSFAEKNIALLDANPRAVCSVSKIVYFLDGAPDLLAPDTGPIVGSPARRLHRYFMDILNCGRLYGVYRTAVLQECWPPGLHIYGADWVGVGLTLLKGDHLEVPEVLLLREGQKTGHYIERMGLIDRFEPTWLDHLIPLRRLNREFRRRVSLRTWFAILPSLAYLNARHSAERYVHFAPALKPPLRLARRFVNLFGIPYGPTRS